MIETDETAIKGFSAYRLALLVTVISIVMSACASVGEQEGGISGTGNDINCEQVENKTHPLCTEK